MFQRGVREWKEGKGKEKKKTSPSKQTFHFVGVFEAGKTGA